MSGPGSVPGSVPATVPASAPVPVPPSVHDLGLRPGDGPGELASAVDQLLDTFPQPPLLLGLGEPTHGVEEFPRLRNDMLMHLVHHHGYRSLAVESDWLAATAIDDHITAGTGDFDHALTTGFSHGWGTSPANRDLVVRLRAHNAGLDPADQVRFHGFDAPIEQGDTPSPRTALLAAHAYLTEHLPAHRVPYEAETLRALLGDDEPWTDPAAFMDPARSVGDSEQARTLRLAADDVLAVYESELPGLRQRDPAFGQAFDTAFDRAHAHARTARGLLRYHAALASTGPDRMSVVIGVRGAMMAENLLALAAADARRGPCLVFAHNIHLQRNRSVMGFAGTELRWWSAGALVSASAVGDRYAFVAAHLEPSALPDPVPMSHLTMNEADWDGMDAIAFLGKETQGRGGEENGRIRR
ncbi:erythromycin esterase family protein [Streptomyces sp. NPDC021093]|uniref:erythromycin esterase family protein n=1 Tax=Streptomyces sp. NPDC021093 TaxID=3365112 RepID=UPI0037A8402A